MIKIYGASDDLVEIDGDVSDEIGCYNSAVEVMVLAPDGGGLIVVADYVKAGDAAVWSFSCRQVAEGFPVPWPVSIKQEHEYSIAVVIENDKPVSIKTRTIKLDEHGQ